MTPEQWKEFDPYFTSNECGEGMSYSFMEKFLLFRLDVNPPVIVHSGCESDGHASMGKYYSTKRKELQVKHDRKDIRRWRTATDC